MTLNDKQYIASVLERVAGHVAPEEGRQFERHPFPSIVKVTPLASPGARLHPYLTRSCPTIDLSKSGMRLLWIGSQVPERVVIAMDGADGAIEIECAVAWSRELGPARVEMGLRFLGRYPCSEELPAANEQGDQEKCSTG